jgi:hypothetical protein
MKRAAFYARVSTDAQQKEATIDSQLFELKKHIAAAGHALVKEYIDESPSYPNKGDPDAPPAPRRTCFLCAEHDRQLGCESPLSSLMTAKD